MPEPEKKKPERTVPYDQWADQARRLAAIERKGKDLDEMSKKIDTALDTLEKNKAKLKALRESYGLAVDEMRDLIGERGQQRLGFDPTTGEVDDPDNDDN